MSWCLEIGKKIHKGAGEVFLFCTKKRHFWGKVRENVGLVMFSRLVPKMKI